MDEFRFIKWKVYKDSKDLFKNILRIYRKIPSDIKYSLGEQIIRSSLSIVLNISEGAGKQSDKDMNRFFNIAIGSVYETVANLDILCENNFIDAKTFQLSIEKLDNIKKQLGGFKKKLKNC